MRIEKRLIEGEIRDVRCYGSTEEYEDSEKDRRNLAHADRVAEKLAKNKSFIDAIAKAIGDMEVL